jgi:membrane-associated phospholipid phosphatase
MTLVERPIQLVHCGSGYSFTSSHAANHTALAVIILCLWNEKWNKKHVFILLWATLIGYAQVYVGVHYPLDILGGMLVGAIIARIIYAFCRNVFSMTN